LTNRAFGTKIENDSQIQFAAEYFFCFLPKLKEVFFYGLQHKAGRIDYISA
jgi:hypothetical protein